MRVIFHLLTWNGARYLPSLFESLNAQTAPWELRIIDNASTDDSVEIIREYAPESLIAVNSRNLGFAEGQNQLLRFTRDKTPREEHQNVVIVFLNQDILLDPQFVAELRAAAEAHPDVGAFAPKLMRAEMVGEDGLEFSKTDILDSTGFSLPRTWRIEERGAGEVDHGQHDGAVDIMGAGGALALWRLSTLLDVMIDDEIFDRDFFAYREDCDLAMRALRFGVRSRYVPAARAWHVRGLYGAARRSLWTRLWDRRGNRPLQQALASRNQLLFLIKNLTAGDVAVSLPRLVFQEGGRTLYSLLFESETRKYLVRMTPFVRRALKKRRVIMARAKAAPVNVRVWMRERSK